MTVIISFFEAQREREKLQKEADIMCLIKISQNKLYACNTIGDYDGRDAMLKTFFMHVDNLMTDEKGPNSDDKAILQGYLKDILSYKDLGSDFKEKASNRLKRLNASPSAQNMPRV